MLWPKWKLVLFSLLTLGFVFGGLWQFFTGNDAGTRLEGIVCVLLCGGCCGFGVFVGAGGHGKLIVRPDGKKEIGLALWQVGFLILLGLTLLPTGWMIAFVIGNSTPFFPRVLQIVVADVTGILSACCGLFLVYYAVVKSRTVGRLVIGPDGLELCLWGLKPRLIPWSDIQGFGVVKISNQEQTTISLNTYQSILRNLTKQEENAAKKYLKRYRLAAFATVIVGVANFGDPSDVIDTIPASAETESVSQILLYSRRRFGGEFLIPAMMRDRSAQDFAIYLEKLRQTAFRTY